MLPGRGGGGSGCQGRKREQNALVLIFSPRVFRCRTSKVKPEVFRALLHIFQSRLRRLGSLERGTRLYWVYPWLIVWPVWPVLRWTWKAWWWVVSADGCCFALFERGRGSTAR